MHYQVKFALPLDSVSYTHLDVYKRQVGTLAVRTCQVQEVPSSASSSSKAALALATGRVYMVSPPQSLGGAGPVSYTHLDVYKRQDSYSAMAPA